MNDLISRQAAIDAVINTEPVVFDVKSLEPHQKTKDVINALNEVPSVKPDVPDTNVGELINRQAAINAICEHGTDLERRGITVLAVANYKQVTVDLLEKLPSVQPRKGKWIRTRTMTHDGELYCDQCEQEHPEQKIIWNFCPNCGADMREGDAE